MNLPNDPEITVLCQNCGEQLDIERQGPCQRCGQEPKIITITVEDDVGLFDKLKGCFHEHGLKHWSKQFESGDELYTETNELRTVVRVKDWKYRHDPDSYYELITNRDTGEINKRVEQALVEHQGYGSAKGKIPEFPDEWHQVTAYYIWQKEGCPSGRHKNHWNKAKSELRRLWKEGHLPKPQ